MPRKKILSLKKRIGKDPVYNNDKLYALINAVMQSGKKSIAERIVYGSLEHIKQKLKTSNPVEVFERALNHIQPLVEVKARRVGGATYQVPVEVNPIRARTLALRWLIVAARKRADRGMILKLASELIDAADEDANTGGSKGRGGAIQKRDTVHKMANANKAFAHFQYR